MTRRRGLATVASGLSVVACTVLFDPGKLDRDSGIHDEFDGQPASREMDGAAADVVSDVDRAGDGRGPTGLDEGVALPPLGGARCDPPLPRYQRCPDLGCCPDFGACRMATPGHGTCEPCPDTRCDARIGEACSQSADCDRDLACFRGVCTPACLRGTTECGPVRDCLDVGHEAFGLCDPAGL